MTLSFSTYMIDLCTISAPAFSLSYPFLCNLLFFPYFAQKWEIKRSRFLEESETHRKRIEYWGQNMTWNYLIFQNYLLPFLSFTLLLEDTRVLVCSFTIIPLNLTWKTLTNRPGSKFLWTVLKKGKGKKNLPSFARVLEKTKNLAGHSTLLFCTGRQNVKPAAHVKERAEQNSSRGR